MDDGAAHPGDHLVAIPDSDWALWRWICLRTAGFPASLPARLVAPDAARATDELLDARDARQSLTATVLEVLRRAATGATDEVLHKIRRAQKRAVKGGLPAPEDVAAGEPEIERLRATVARVEALEKNLRLAFDAERNASGRALREIASDERFREAVTWQNRRAIDTAFRPLLKTAAEGRNSETRRSEELVAKYLHRYTTKNESIGFFGPWGWGRFGPTSERIVVCPGPTMLARRETFFEQWGIDALANVLSKNAATLAWVAPSRFGFVRLEGRVVHSPLTGRHELSARQERALRGCDGETPARQIAVELVRDHGDDFANEGAVFDALGELRAKTLISWGLEFPMTWRPDTELRARLERIADVRLREECLAPLRELESARHDIAAAAGDAGRLRVALAGLDDVFTRITGAEATRHAGSTYASRSLVFEDCRRDIDLTVGSTLLAELGPALRLVLDSARSLTYEVMAACEPQLRALYEDMARQAGARTLPFAEFWFRAQRILHGKTEGAVVDVARSIRERWGRILSLSSEQRRAQFRSEDLRAAASEAFNAPEAGWSAARHQSPDVMIGAKSVEAISRGEYFAVLGEIHVGINTLQIAASTSQHPAPDELTQALIRDMPEPRVRMAMSKTGLRSLVRGVIAVSTPHDFEIEANLETSALPRERTIAIADLVLEDDNDRLIVRSEDGRLRFDLQEIVGPAFRTTVGALDFAPEMVHTPRVTFDKLVVRREAWRFAPADVPFARETSELERFIGARRWARAHGLPRFVFLRSSLEVKPLYVDFENPVAVDILAKFVRLAQEHVSGTSSLSVSEMLPTLDDVWLPDAEGNRYTSELRLVALDRRRTSPR